MKCTTRGRTMTSQIEEQVERLSKMSFALGEATILVVLFSQYLARKNAPLPMPEASILRLIDRFLERCNQIYHEQEEEEKICPHCNAVHENTPNCKRTIPIAKEPYTKEWQERCQKCNKYHLGLATCTWPPNCS